MPSPSRPSKTERLSRFVSRLRSNRTAGSPLLVQSGFPTSLADLVVKNRAKLFRRRKKPPPLLDNPESIEEVGDDRNAIDDEIDPVEDPNVTDEDGSVGMKRGGLWFLVVKVAALAALAVGGKWVVVGITILAFGLLVLEFVGVSKPMSNAVEVSNKDQLEIEMEGFDLRGGELVSPMREVESNDSRSSSRSDSMSDILTERRDFDAVDNVGKDHQDTGNSCKPKRKRFLRKLFRRKNRKKKDEGLSPSSSLDDSTTSHEGGVPIEDRENGDEEYFSSEDATEVFEIKFDAAQDDMAEIRFERWRKLVFFVVILLGLLGGKVLALVFTVACYLLSVCTGTVWKKWKVR